MADENILITSIGSFSGQAVVESLRRNRHGKIVGADIYPKEWLAVSASCDEVYRVPKTADTRAFEPAILEIVKKENVRIILPLTDVDVDFFNQNRERFLALGATPYIASAECLAVARDKWALYEFFSRTNTVFCVPTILAKDAANWAQFPAIAKPRRGRSSQGLMRLENRIDLQAACARTDYVIQPFVEGAIYTVDYVRQAEFQQDVAVARKELIRTANGAGITVQMVDDPYLTQIADFIGKRLNINGCINIEFIRSQDQYYLLEINPRFSAGIAFSAIAGYDMVENHLRCFEHRLIDPPITVQPRIYIKKIVEMA